MNFSKQSPRFIASWSGGKDSAYAFERACKKGAKPVGILTMVEEGGAFSRSHRLSQDILFAHARALDLPLFMGAASWADYEEIFAKTLIQARDECRANTVVFGDIDIIGHREWAEKMCARKDIMMQSFFPLWDEKREDLVYQILNSDQKSIIVSCCDQLGESFLGRMFDEQTVSDIKALGIDICGENGEFHTLVLDNPCFKEPVQIVLGHKQKHTPLKEGAKPYWFIDLKLDKESSKTTSF